MYYDDLRSRGFYALAEYCKMRDKFNADFWVKLTPVQNRWIVLSGLPGDTSLVKTLIEEYSTEGYALNTLRTMDTIAKREIVRSIKPHFSNQFHYHKSLLRGSYGRYPEIKTWFLNIATMNPDSYWGSAALKVVQLIDKRLARQEE